MQTLPPAEAGENFRLWQEGAFACFQAAVYSCVWFASDGSALTQAVNAGINEPDTNVRLSWEIREAGAAYHPSAFRAPG